MKHFLYFNNATEEAAGLGNYADPWVSYTANVGLRYNIKRLSTFTYDSNTTSDYRIADLKKPFALMTFLDGVYRRNHRVMVFYTNNGVTTYKGIYTVSSTISYSHTSSNDNVLYRAVLSGDGQFNEYKVAWQTTEVNQTGAISYGNYSNSFNIITTFFEVE